MKKCFLFLFVNLAVFAEDSLPKEVTLHNGFYIGLGAEAVRDKLDWEVQWASLALGVDEYKSLHHNYNKHHIGAQFHLGYKGYTPFFYAIEINCSFNKLGEKRNYSEDEVPGQDTTANLELNKRNDIAFVLKIGKTFRNITPYVLFGVHTQKVLFDLTYPRINNFGLTYDENNFKYSNRFNGGMIGCGISYDLPQDFTLSVEYCVKNSRNKRVDAFAPLDHNPDLNHRHYFLRNSKQHCISIRVSKNILNI